MVTQATEELINGLTALQRAKVAEELFDNVFSHVPAEVVRNNADTELREQIVTGIERRFRAEQDEIVQQLLSAYARDPNLEPILLAAVTAMSAAETLSIRRLVTVGMLINLTLFMATTTVEIKKDAQGQVTWECKKGPYTPELLEQAGKVFTTGKG